jgi:phage gpG-like protein
MAKSMFKMNAVVKLAVDNSVALRQSLRKLEKNQVLVGVPAEKAPRDPEEQRGPINNAALAYIHNFGSPSGNIPARPFMEPGIKDNTDKIVPYLEAAAREAVLGNASGVTKNLTAAGITAATGIKMKIQTGPFIPLKPSTIAQRQRRGRMGTRPLIDTGQLRNAITFVVRAK